MRSSLLQSLLVIVGASAFAVACSGPGNFAPSASQSNGAQEPGSAQSDAIRSMLLEHFSPDLVDRIASAASATCGTTLPVPGKYAVLFATGAIKGTTFNANSSASFWDYDSVKAGKKPTPGPSTSPTTGPSSTPSPTSPEYIYLGTYTTAKSGHGCAILLGTVSHKNFPGTKYNAVGIGSPNVGAKYPVFKIISMGPLALTITKLSATGGKGTATLQNSGGGSFDTGTVTLTSRIKT